MNAARLRLFWILIFVGLLPFVILSFLNSMALDDYLYYELFRTRSFFGVQRFLYETWGGRYTSTFLIGCFVRMDLPGRFPWLPTLFYFFATWGAICYLLSTLFTLLRLDHLQIGRERIFQAGLLLFILFLYVQADIATGFYWFSAMVVYQTAFILFLLLSATLVRRLESTQRAPGIDILLVILVLLIIGCNEIMAIFIPFLLISLMLACRFYDREVPRWLWLLLGIAFCAGLLIFFTSGVMTYRQKGMNAHTGILAIIPIIGFQIIAVLYYIFKEPMFWLGAAAIFVLGSRIAQNWPSPNLLVPFRRKNIFLPGLIALMFLIGSSLAVFLFASRGSIPPRTLNNLSDITTCCFLALCLLAGVNQGARRPFASFSRPPRAVQLAVLVAVTLASVNYLSAWKSVISGYFYHAVLTERDHKLRAAASKHLRTVTLAPYDSTLKEHIDKVFPHGIFETVRTLFLEKPQMLYYYDGAGVGDPNYAHFYGLDSIILRQN